MASRALLGMWPMLMPVAASASALDAAVRAGGEKFLAGERGA
ncbi:hypothetical protein FHR20_000382 [Sphingomonas leidyi]|uniref:Uncharacterized protein n=1 Tax=Sphingomonas leidyi TaxID=68569 RepID=A0A7X5UXA3_9SPHN|nr:hypothetical protein [Sphingomonas leidyi]NIJ63451.1 hypothetical protein [Sphingomonas leidyi]